MTLALRPAAHVSCSTFFLIGRRCFMACRYLLQSPQPEQQPATAAASSSPPPTAAGADAAPPGSAQKQQQKEKQREKKQAASSGKDAVTVVQLGSVGVALWWEPTRHSHDLGVVERVSFCLLPGEVKVRKELILSACCLLNVLSYGDMPFVTNMSAPPMPYSLT
jgi:hypothetical protein